MIKLVRFSFFLNVVLWLLWFILLFFWISPDTYSEIFLFLGILFLCLGLSFSFPFYFFYKKKYPKFTDLKQLFRRAVKWGFFISFGIVMIAFLRAFHIDTLLNIGLVGIFYIAVFVHLRGRK